MHINIKMINSYNFLPGNLNNLRVSGIVKSADCVNSMGYRAPEFNTVDWKNSVVIFGCSYVYGTAINNEDTISSNLEKIIGRPVINMGVPASSIVYSFINQLNMHEQDIEPYAVINCWTATQRMSYFTDFDTAAHIGPWIDDNNNTGLDLRLYKKMFSIWNFNDSNSAVYGSIFQRMAKIICKNSKYLEYSFFPLTAKQLDVRLLDHVDFAADGSHPGPRTTFNTAKIIAEDLKRR